MFEEIDHGRRQLLGTVVMALFKSPLESVPYWSDGPLCALSTAVD